MKIVFLDADTVDLGDVDVRGLRRLGEYHSLPGCPGNRIPALARDAEIIITNKVQLNHSNLNQFKKLRLICVAATGVNNIGLPAARVRGVAVTNVAGYSTTTVVEHTLMFLLAFGHRLKEHDQAVRKGKWSRSPHFTLLDFPFRDLSGRNLGIVGLGTIGKKVARVARSLGMQVKVAKIPGRRYAAGAKPKRHSLNQVLKDSDFVSLHCALSPQTEGLIDGEALARMKPEAYLINLARGPVVNEAHVARALSRDELAGYATDVTSQEPLPKSHPFLNKSLESKLWLTPHVAWASQESRQRLIDEIAKNIAAFKKGRRRNRLL